MVATTEEKGNTSVKQSLKPPPNSEVIPWSLVTAVSIKLLIDSIYISNSANKKFMLVSFSQNFPQSNKIMRNIKNASPYLVCVRKSS